jgi:hypothetical protein
MKNYIFLIFGLFAITLLGSCKKEFLDQTNPNAISIDQNFQTENDVALAVYGAYQALRSSNCKGENALTWTDDRSDDVNTTDNQSNNGEPFQFTAFSLTPSNSYLYSHWTALYTPITRANQVLAVIDKISFASDTTRSQYKAEMKFIRALLYFDLVREFGDVPLVTTPLSTADQIAAATFRAPRADVYAQIVKDLKDVVASNLPVVQSVSNKGRVSLQAANGLLGQVYLTMAVTDVDAANATNNLNNAKTYLLACYNQRTFTTLSTIPYVDVFDVSKKSTCPEIIWQIVYKQGDPNYYSSIAANNQAKGETINSLVTSSGAGGTLTLDLFKEFEVGDPRTTFSIKYAANPAVQSYFITKFRDASAAAGTLGYGGNDCVIMRYADIILNLAEVSFYLGDNAGAINYINMVRARAGVPDYATMMTNPNYAAKYPTLKLAILHERRIELAFEHHRWHDLIRFFKPQELVTYIQSKSQADYNNSPLTNCSTKDYYFPIPVNETRLDPVKMYQNPGY